MVETKHFYSKKIEWYCKIDSIAQIFIIRNQLWVSSTYYCVKYKAIHSFVKIQSSLNGWPIRYKKKMLFWLIFTQRYKETPQHLLHWLAILPVLIVHFCRRDEKLFYHYCLSNSSQYSTKKFVSNEIKKHLEELLFWDKRYLYLKVSGHD